MTIWLPQIEDRDGPKYVAIADAMDDDIRSGRLAPDEKLPPHRDLAWRLGCTVGTVTRAYALARQRGLVSGEIGRGTFVRGANASILQTRPSPSAMQGFSHTAEDGVIDLTMNAPPIESQGQNFSETLRGIAARDDIDSLLRYMPSAGDPAHRAIGAKWIARRGLDVAPESVVLTAGAQQAIALALAVHAGFGGVALAEELTWCGAIDACHLHGIRLKGVGMDNHGMRADALDAAVRETGARVVFLVPTLHNPTAVTMPEERRREIVEVARRHDLIIIEDDVYGFLPENVPPAIASLAPERTVYITSASKSMSAGLRVGWIACLPGLADRIAAGVRAQCVALPPLMAEIASLWIENGTAESMMESKRREMAARFAVAGEELTGLDFHGDKAGYHLFLKLPAPWRASEFADMALAGGVRLLPGETFAIGAAPPPQAIRLSLSNARNRDELRQALRIVANLARSMPARHQAVI